MDVVVVEEPNVLLLNLSRPMALKIIRDLAKQSERVRIRRHASERMVERGISLTQILRCLEKGRIVEGPARSIKGNWELKMEVFSAGEPIGVAGALDRDDQGNYFIVITVM